MKHWKWLLAFLVCATVLYFMLAPGKPRAVFAQKPRIKEIVQYIEEEGKTQLSREKKIFPSMAGFLGPVNLEVGDRVRAGQVIAVIEDFEIKKEIESLQAQIRSAESQIAGIDRSKPKKEELERARILIQQAQDNLEIARREYEVLRTNFAQTARDMKRISDLFQKGAATEYEKDTIETRLNAERDTLEKQAKLMDVLKGGISVAKANLSILEEARDDPEYLRGVYGGQIDSLRSRIAILANNLKKTELRVPHDGIVLERVTQGDVYLSFVTPDYYILKVGDLSSLEVRVDILSDDIHKVRLGSSVEIFGAALGERRIEGKVAQIYPSAFTKISSLGIEQQRVAVIVRFDPSGTPLNPGYRVDVRISTKAVKDALVVPARAVFSISGQSHLFVVEKGKARLRKVVTGIETDDETQILEGLSPEEEIIVEQSNDLQEGDRVILRPPN